MTILWPPFVGWMFFCSLLFRILSRTRVKSLVPILKGSKRKGHEYLGFEHFNEKALIAKDGWKIIQPGNKAQWELYNLNEDRTEMHNVADKYPDRLAKMQKQYEEWAKRCMVVPSPK